MIVNRSPVKEMSLEIEFRDAGAVKRVADDGHAVSAEKYRAPMRLAPGYAEIFTFPKGGR